MQTIDEMVKEIEEGGLDAVLATIGPQGLLVMDAIAPQLESIPNIGVQVTVTAILAGFAWASIEGHPTAYERDHALFITAEDRLKLWVACMWAAYRAAMEIRKHPDCPSPTPKSQRM